MDRVVETASRYDARRVGKVDVGRIYRGNRHRILGRFGEHNDSHRAFRPQDVPGFVNKDLFAGPGIVDLHDAN